MRTTTFQPFAPEHETPDGWRLPLEGNLIGWRYVRPLDFAFEVLLEGDDDLTIGLERPFAFGGLSHPPLYDPRTPRKSELAPLLNLGQLTIGEFLVKRNGQLAITFSTDSRLVVGPADDGRAWRLEWPRAGEVVVSARPGTGLTWPNAAAPAPTLELDRSSDRGSLEPVRDGAILNLPIKGIVAHAAVSDLSIELAIPTSGTGEFCIHFGGSLEITGPAFGEVWRGRGDADDRAMLSRVLDFIDREVIRAQVDDGEHLRLSFRDGAQLTADPSTWEAHWPSAPDLEEHWVPRPGPNIP